MAKKLLFIAIGILFFLTRTEFLCDHECIINFAFLQSCQIYIFRGNTEAPNCVTIGGQNGMKPASSRGGIRSVYWDGDLGDVTFEIVLFCMGRNILV